MNQKLGSSTAVRCSGIRKDTPLMLYTSAFDHLDPSEGLRHHTLKICFNFNAFGEIERVLLLEKYLNSDFFLHVLTVET